MEERAVCFTFVVFRMSCHCNRSLTLPHGVIGWSIVYDCGISWPYSLTFYRIANLAITDTKSKEPDKDQESIQSSCTPDTR